MNAGFSSLSALKAQLLNVDLRTSTDYDALITSIGLGMAGLVGGYCNREFARVEGDTFIVPGNTRLLNLPRYPVEAVTALDFKVRLANSWQDGLAALYNWNAASGIVDLAYYLTDHFGQVRITYTAGFWWDTSEDASGTLPAGAAALPDEILSAWTLQCQEVWRRTDALGLSAALIKADMRPLDLTGIELLPIVKDMLRDHIRFAP